jgi:regulatory protein YycI of two-component signal transduction system YycFG
MTNLKKIIIFITVLIILTVSIFVVFLHNSNLKTEDLDKITLNIDEVSKTDNLDQDEPKVYDSGKFGTAIKNLFSGYEIIESANCEYELSAIQYKCIEISLENDVKVSFKFAEERINQIGSGYMVDEVLNNSNYINIQSGLTLRRGNFFDPSFDPNQLYINLQSCGKVKYNFCEDIFYIKGIYSTISYIFPSKLTHSPNKSKELTEEGKRIAEIIDKMIQNL